MAFVTRLLQPKLGVSSSSLGFLVQERQSTVQVIQILNFNDRADLGRRVFTRNSLERPAHRGVPTLKAFLAKIFAAAFGVDYLGVRFIVRQKYFHKSTSLAEDRRQSF